MHVMQLVASVHLDLVQAGLVAGPARHELSGHRELSDVADFEQIFELIPRGQALSISGSSGAWALRSHLSELAPAQHDEVSWLPA
jgi:hypothetical protein